MAENKAASYLEQALDHAAPSNWREWQSERDVKRATASYTLTLLWRALRELQG